MRLLSVDLNRSEMFQVSVEISPEVVMNMSHEYALRHYPDLFQTETTRFRLTLAECETLRTKLISKILETYKHADYIERIESVAKGPIHLNIRMRSTLGRAHYLHNKIELHFRALNGNREQFEKTFAHELAHLLSVAIFGPMGRGHGRLFKVIMLALGHVPNRTHSHDVSEFKRKHKRVALAKCGCNDSINITQKRLSLMNQGKRYKCTLCNKSLTLVA